MNRSTSAESAADGGNRHFFISPSFGGWRQNPCVGATLILEARSVFFWRSALLLGLGRENGRSDANTLAQGSFATQLARVDRLDAQRPESAAGNLAVLSEARTLPV